MLSELISHRIVDIKSTETSLMIKPPSAINLHKHLQKQPFSYRPASSPTCSSNLPSPLLPFSQASALSMQTSSATFVPTPLPPLNPSTNAPQIDSEFNAATSVIGGLRGVVTSDMAVLSLFAQVESAYPDFITLTGIELPDSTDTAVTAFATNPYSYIAARPTSWETNLPTSVRSAWDSFYTSIALAVASSYRSELSITATPTPPPAAGSAPATGKGVWVAAGAVAGLAGFVGFLL